MSVRAIRGAIQVSENTPAAIAASTKKLLGAILEANGLSEPDLISVLLTSSPDLNAAFPAAGAREAGFTSTPLLCASEIDVPAALPRTVRVMLHCNTELPSTSIRHIYLDGAEVLRSDLAK